MFREKKNKLKVTIGALALITAFTGIYLGINSIAFGLAADGQGSVAEDDFAEALAEEAVLIAEAVVDYEQRALWAEEDARLREEIRLSVLEEQRLIQEGYHQPEQAVGVLLADNEDLLDGEQWEHCEWEWIPMTEEEIEAKIDWIMLTTPRERHLSKEQAIELAIDWIYEEFGLEMDTNASNHNFMMWFEHEDLGIVNRSFWTGNFYVLEPYLVDNYQYPGMFHYQPLESIIFAMDGITGARVGIMEDMLFSEPEVVEVRFDGMRLNVSYNSTELMAIISPSFAVAVQSYHLTMEEAAKRGAEIIYQQFQVNLDGYYMDLSLVTMDHGYMLYSEWRVSVHNGRFDEGRQTLFFLGFCAITGDLSGEVDDVRGVIGPGFNNPIYSYTNINLTNMSFVLHYTLFREIQPGYLTTTEIGTQVAEMIYDKFGESLDGLTLEMSLHEFYLGGRFTCVWDIVVRSSLEGRPLFSMVLDATTGELIPYSKINDLR